jgi:hypothetical protein
VQGCCRDRRGPSPRGRRKTHAVVKRTCRRCRREVGLLGDRCSGRLTGTDRSPRSDFPTRQWRWCQLVALRVSADPPAGGSAQCLEGLNGPGGGLLVPEHGAHAATQSGARGVEDTSEEKLSCHQSLFDEGEP